MRVVFSISLILFFLFQCEKEQNNIDAIDIVNEYIENPVFGINEHETYIISGNFFPEAQKEKFFVTSFFDKKKISFSKKEYLEVPNFRKIPFKKIEIDSIKKFSKLKLGFYTISKPILSEEKNYALIEVGVFNYKDNGYTKFSVYEMPNLIHVFLYKKENGKWKRLELITQIRI